MEEKQSTKQRLMVVKDSGGKLVVDGSLIVKAYRQLAETSVLVLTNCKKPPH